MSRSAGLSDPGPAEVVASSSGFLFGLGKGVTAMVSTQLEPSSGGRETLVSAILGRKDRWWFTRPWWKVPEQPAWPRATRGAGTVFGSVWVSFEPGAHVVWIGGERVTVPEDDNVIFVDRPDRGHHALVLAGTTRLQAEFPPFSMDAGAWKSRALKLQVQRITDVLLSSAEVRRFVGV